MTRKFFIFGSFALLVGVFSLPSGILSWFDGLPWTSGSETSVLVVLVPCLLVLGWRFLALQRVIMGLGVLFLFKMILFVGAPSSGLGVKVYTNPSNYDNGKWTRTYASLWNEEISGLLVRPWTQKFDFPTDWFLPSKFSPIDELSLIEGNLEEKFRHMKLWLTLDGAALLPEGTGLALVVSGVVEGKLVANNSQGQSLNIPLVSSFEEASKRFGELPVGGDWEISGNLYYYGENWTLIPVLVEKGGNVAPAFEKGVLWQNFSVIEKSSSSLTFYRITAKVFDYGLCAFLFAWMVWCLRQLVQSKVLTLPLACFSMAGVGLIWVFEPILDRIHPDPTHLAHLGLATTAAGGGLLIWWIWKKQLSTLSQDHFGHTVFLLFGPALLIFYLNRWWPDVGRTSSWSMGDDGLIYQKFARHIALTGDWIRGVYDFWLGQPLYRFIVAIYHSLFGQSAIAQRMADVWCYLGAAALIASWAGKLRLSALSALLGSLVYLSITQVSTFRYHVGLGLQEATAMIFMMLAGWVIIFRPGNSYPKILLAGFLAMVAYLVRQDHIGVLAGLGFMILDPGRGSFVEAWRVFWDRFRINFSRLMTYWTVLALGPLLVIFHNGWFSGKWYLTSTSHSAFANKGEVGLKAIYLLLSGNPWPQGPGIACVILVTGTFTGLLALFWRPKILQSYPLSLSLAIAGLLAPYFLLDIGGYEPRFSIHLLPILTLSCIILVDSLIRRNRLTCSPES